MQLDLVLPEGMSLTTRSLNGLTDENPALLLAHVLKAKANLVQDV